MTATTDANEDDEEHSRWLSLRRQTLIAFCIICFGLGFEYSLIFPSLLYYLKEVIQTQYAEVCYGIALSAYPTSSIIGAFTIARYADRTKRTRRVVLLLLACEITGNLLYAIPFSPFFPIFGRLVAGFGDVANMVMCGEVVRCYATEEVTSRISIMVVCFSIGFTLSPGMNIVFNYFDFHIGPIHVVFANMPGLFMAICFAVVVFMAYAMVSDISREYDLKGQMEKQFLDGAGKKIIDTRGTYEGDNDDINSEYYAVHWGDNPAKMENSRQHKRDIDKSPVQDTRKRKGAYTSLKTSDDDDQSLLSSFSDHSEDNDFSSMISREGDSVQSRQHSTSISLPENDQPGVQRTGTKEGNTYRYNSVLLTILTTFDLVLLLVFCFVCSYTLFGFDTLVALIATHYFNFTASQTSIIFIIDGALYGIVLLSLVKLSKFASDFSIIIFAVVIQLLGLVAVLSLSINHTHFIFNYLRLTLFVLACSTTWCIEEVLTRSLFGKLVPSSCQSYAEGIRRSVSSIAFIISGVTTAGLFKYLTEISAALIVATLILLAVFVWRRKTLLNPVPLFYYQHNGADYDDDEEEDTKEDMEEE